MWKDCSTDSQKLDPLRPHKWNIQADRPKQPTRIVRQHLFNLHNLIVQPARLMRRKDTLFTLALEFTTGSPARLSAPPSRRGGSRNHRAADTSRCPRPAAA